MGKIILLMGPTGAGKSVQGELLASRHRGVYLSSGALLRRDPEMKKFLETGYLAPAEHVQRVVGEAMGKALPDQMVILDGFPRTLEDVTWLEESLPRFGHSLYRVIHIEIDEATSEERLLLRGRSDDSKAARQHKWQYYVAKTAPVLNHYRDKGYLRGVDGRGSVEEVSSRIEAALL